MSFLSPNDPFTSLFSQKSQYQCQQPSSDVSERPFTSVSGLFAFSLLQLTLHTSMLLKPAFITIWPAHCSWLLIRIASTLFILAFAALHQYYILIILNYITWSLPYRISQSKKVLNEYLHWCLLICTWCINKYPFVSCRHPCLLLRYIFYIPNCTRRVTSSIWDIDTVWSNCITVIYFELGLSRYSSVYQLANKAIDDQLMIGLR